MKTSRRDHPGARLLAERRDGAAARDRARRTGRWEEWTHLREDHPVFADVLLATRTRSLSVFEHFDEDIGETVLRSTAAGPVVDLSVYPNLTGRSVALAAWLDGPGDRDAETALLAALDAWVPDPLRAPGIRAVRGGSTSKLPRFGWRQSVSLDEVSDWDALWGALDKAAIWRLARPCFDADAQWDEDPARVAELFARHGVRVPFCARCGEAVTSRHPHWPGVPVSWLDTGPVCGAWENSLHVLADSSVPHPRDEIAPEEETAVYDATCGQCERPIGRPRGGEGCGRCPTRRARPHRCAASRARSSTTHDASSNLVDIAYPHQPTDDPGPAADAIATALREHLWRPSM